MTQRLVSGSRVTIVGGGPAGSFTALHLLRLSAERGLGLKVTICEPRDFSQPGPGGCNKCAGILSSTLLSNLEEIGLHVPAAVIQSELHTYILHLDDVRMPINRPDHGKRIISIYRGGGPRLGAPPRSQSFDGWLLEKAEELGAVISRNRIQRILPGPRPVLVTRNRSFEADLVVLATGVNSRCPLAPAWKYRPPRTEVMAQDEVMLPDGREMDGSVHIFFRYPPGLVFGGVIPKGRYANISLLGKGLPNDAIADFLEERELSQIFEDGSRLLCGCTPRVAISPATGYFSDRMVAVGDAAVTRLYKDGIGSAYITARAAAQTAVYHGISRRDFARGYAPVCRSITADNQFGRVLFGLWAFTRRSKRALNAWQRTILAEAELPSSARIHTRTLWSMFTGDEPYRVIFSRSFFSLVALRSLLRGAWISRRNP